MAAVEPLRRQKRKYVKLAWSWIGSVARRRRIKESKTGGGRA